LFRRHGSEFFEAGMYWYTNSWIWTLSIVRTIYLQQLRARSVLFCKSHLSGVFERHRIRMWIPKSMRQMYCNVDFEEF
jgi:hypothetical protein